MSFRSRAFALAAVSSFAVGCSDSPAPAEPIAAPRASAAPAPAGLFHRFVSIGTSISMGWQSDGVVGSGQAESWTVQLAALAGRDQTQPRLQETGCKAPLMAPLALGIRTSGEGAAVADAAAACSALEPGVTLPAQSVAIASATTADALNTTPESNTHPLFSRLYSRVLPSGTTQLQAALAQKPKFISVELGGNEVLNARSGIAIPGVTITPYAVWAQQYETLIAQVAAEVDRGVLMGLINDAADFPGFRRGAEIWNDRLRMGALHVAVDQNCANSQNLIFVPVRVPTAVAMGAASKANQGPMVPFTCADFGLGVQDFVLTPGDVTLVNTQLAQMNAFIAAKAEQIGFAYVPLEALYGRADLKPDFNAIALMTGTQPYGPYISLDGIHPNGAGHTVLAGAAASAINARYGLAIPKSRAWMAFR